MNNVLYILFAMTQCSSNNEKVKEKRETGINNEKEHEANMEKVNKRRL